MPVAFGYHTGTVTRPSSSLHQPKFTASVAPTLGNVSPSLCLATRLLAQLRHTPGANMMLCVTEDDVVEILHAHGVNPWSRTIATESMRLAHTGFMIPRFPWRLTVDPVPSGIDPVRACVQVYRQRLPHSACADPAFAFEFQVDADHENQHEPVAL